MNTRIEVCGPIASGKTTYVQNFANNEYCIELEDFSKISMLDDFYVNPLFVSFETEISFTLQHYYQIKKALQVSNNVLCDFSSVNDYAFALAILNEREMNIYDQVFTYAIEKIGKPKKLIRLYASVDELILRIKNRGRQNEQSIDASSLLKFEECLNTAINLFYNDVPIIKVDTEQSFAHNCSKDFFEV